MYLYFRKTFHPISAIFPASQDIKKVGHTGRLTLCNLTIMLAAARNQEQELNKLRMRRVREAQRAAKVDEKVFSPAG